MKQSERNEENQNLITNNTQSAGPESDYEPKQGKKKLFSKIKSFIRKTPKVVVASISGVLAVLIVVPIVVIIISLFPIAMIFYAPIAYFYVLPKTKEMFQGFGEIIRLYFLRFMKKNN